MPFIKNTILLTKRVYTAEPPVIIGQVGSGEITAAYLSNTGRIWTWGENTRGQLGQNLSTAAVAFVPASIAGVTKTFCTLVTTGQSHLAIDKNGKIWGWGNNSSGQLGDNTVISKFTPVSVTGATKTFCKVGGGVGTPLAIDKYGRLWAWGNNGSGNIGDNSIVGKLTPVSVLGAVKTFCEISKYAGSLAIDKYGQVWAWGYNAYGNLGDNSTVSKLTPVSICGTKKTFCTINASAAGALAIDKYGRLWGWGYNATGQLGDNSTTNRLTPVSVCGAVKTFCKISISSQASYAIDKNGKLWAWGANRLLGANLYTSGNTLTPISVAGALANRIVCDVAGASTDYAFAIDSKGVVWAWGYGHYGGLGNPAYKSVTTPLSVASTKTFCDVVGGFDASVTNHFSAIDNNGRMWSWGFNSVGQFGDNTIIAQDKVTPLSVVGNVKTFCKVAAHGQTSIAIDKNGTVWAWGDNAGGQLGNNSSISQLTPVSILGETKTFCTISAGQFHSLAIDKDGKAWGWGSNGNGRLGDNSLTQRLTPVAVAGSTKTFCKIVGSNQHSLAIDKNGRAWAWGNNTTSGLLGNNSTVSFRTPISVLGAVKTFCEIAARGSIVMAIDKNGRVWGWGAGTSGGLGNNSTTGFRTPVSVAGAVKTFCKISVGGNSFCVAIDKNGRAWAWGNNQYGQLGNGTQVSRTTPVSVAGTVKTFCQITAGHSSVVAIDKNGKAWAWGLNTPVGSGNILIQTLGINTPMFRATPIRVCNL